MFRKRVITSAVIAPLVIAVIFIGVPWVQLVFAFFIVAVCGWEWSKLIPMAKLAYKFLYTLIILLLSGLALLCLGCSALWFWMTGLLWGAIILAILFYPASKRLWGYPWIVGITGCMVLPLFMYAVTIMMTRDVLGPGLFMYIILLVWSADVGAYLVGRVWGNHKLIPQVSPGKTWEGAFGGILLVLLVAIGGAWYFQPEAILCWYLSAIILAVQSIFGDLHISMLKRRCQLKDTGSILPGHGGMLDRLDSLLAVTPLADILYTYCFTMGT